MTPDDWRHVRLVEKGGLWDVVTFHCFNRIDRLAKRAMKKAEDWPTERLTVEAALETGAEIEQWIRKNADERRAAKRNHA